MAKKKYTDKEADLADKFFERYAHLDPKYRKHGDKAIRIGVKAVEKTKKIREESYTKGRVWWDKRVSKAKKIAGRK